MAKTSITEIIEAEIDTVLAEDIDFSGELKFSKSLLIKGKFDGKINAEGHLFLGPNSYIKAAINVGILTSYGKIDGNIIAKDRAELSKESIINGDLTTSDLVIESGCKLNGKVTMDSKAIQDSIKAQQTSTQQTPHLSPLKK